MLIVLVIGLIVGCEGGGGGSGSSNSDPTPESGPEDYCDITYRLNFKMYEEFNKPYADADKTGDDDTNMCWAAAAANMLVWAGYATDEDDVFNAFRDHFDNKPGRVYTAIKYYLNQYEFGVYPYEVIVKEYNQDSVIDFIVCALHQEKAITISLQSRLKDQRHSVTVYGYGYKDDEHFVLYYSDSDDHRHQIRSLRLEYNPKGYWENGSWIILSSTSLVNK